MKLVFKYLKPYILAVIAVVVFTAVQAISELALPDSMSDIVTNGIQYGGIKETTPCIINKDDMEFLNNFMDDASYSKIINHYSLVQRGTSATVDKQEIIFNNETYILKDVNDDILDMRSPMVYAYLAISNDVDANSFETKEALNSHVSQLAGGLEDSYDNVAKLYIQQAYKHANVDIEKIQTKYILNAGLKMLGIALISVIAIVISAYLSTRVSTSVAAKVRKDVFSKVESFSSSEFSKFSTSSLITRTSNDVTKIQDLITMMLRMMLISPLMGITAVFKVIKYPGISWLLLVAIGIIIGLMIFLLNVAVPKFEIIQRFIDRINGVMREFLDGMLVIRAFNSEKKEEEVFDETSSSLKRIELFISRAMHIIGPVMTFIMNGLTVLITWFAAKQININAMSVGDMMAFSQYAMHVIISFMMVSATFFIIPRSLVSVRRISEILDTKNSIVDKEDAVDLPETNGDLVFNHVSFKYPGAEEYVLEDINFVAKPGETVAIIGSTGSGKSTIVKLVPRLFDVNEGEITYCGLDIRDVKQSQLHDRIGYASQKAALFTGNIKTNIEFGRDLSEKDLDNAIEISQSKNIIAEKEEGVLSEITQGGTNVSGGQKQRISIARALAKQANIYIFDDSFSALDYETDKKLRKALNDLIAKTKATVLIVAQRISTIKNADKIIVLDSGKIVGEGTHEALLKDCKVYQEIAYSQLSEEELNNA